MAELIGKVLLNRYRVETFLGRGNMAEVYKVWDRKRASHLAIKVLRDDLAEDHVFLRRFKREAQTLARLQHPNIVRFYGFYQEQAVSFILMDYIPGNTLRREIFDAHRPLKNDRIIDVMEAIYSALHFAHMEEIVHCDLKPGNIMIHSNGTILVADFGIARMVDAATLTMLGAGTPAYMSPEQILGKNPTERSDIYSLGVVLFEMLTGGERPYTGERAAAEGSLRSKIQWEQINLKPNVPSRFNPAVHPELDEIVLRCLSKNPRRRYGNALDFLNQLKRSLAAETSSRTLEKQGISEQMVVPPVMQRPRSHEAREGISARPERDKNKAIAPNFVRTAQVKRVVLSASVFVATILLFFVVTNLSATNSKDDNPSSSTAMLNETSTISLLSESSTPISTKVSLPANTPVPLPPVGESSVSQESSEFQPEWVIRNSTVENRDYFDDFSDPQFWTTELGEWTIVSFNMGRLELTDKVIDGFIKWSYTSEFQVNDFYMLIDVEMGECKGKDAFAIVARVDDITASGYAVEFSCDSHYRIRKWVNAMTSDLLNWKYSESIRRGPNSLHQVGIIALDDHLYVVANGEILGNVVDDNYSSGGLSLYVNAIEPPGLTAYFDNLSLWRLD